VTAACPFWSIRYWTDSATSDLIAEVLVVLQEQQLQQQEEDPDVATSSSSGNHMEQQSLAFWLSVMPSAECMTRHRS
jgi:hypothetical protein